MIRSPRKIHKYLSLAISVQLLLWTISGIYFSFNKIEDVRGSQYLKPKEVIETTKGIKIEASCFENKNLNEIKIYENIILDNFDQNIDEYLIYSLFNIIDQDNKYLIINSLTPVNEMSFKLDDLKSRTKNCLVAKIDKPDDELMFALILKNFSDRQITIDKKLIDFIIKRVDRSYDKIFEFIYKIDEISLKKKKSIDFKIIKEVLKV